MTTVFASLGRLGLPAPIKDLAARTWDAIVVGAGHNGLACAAYLARAGWRVLVLEARERVGGACTLEETWPGVRMSPCAYLAGLLHPLVIEELDFARYGYEWTPALNGLFVPFEDGSSIQLYDDEARCEAEIRALAPRDLAGWRAMQALMRRARDVIRPDGPDDAWIGPRRRASSSKNGSATTKRCAGCSSSGAWPSSWSATCATSACRSPTSAKG